MREIRMLRAMRRALEMGLRTEGRRGSLAITGARTSRRWFREVRESGRLVR